MIQKKNYLKRRRKQLLGKKWNYFMKEKKTEKTTSAEDLVLGNCEIATFNPG